MTDADKLIEAVARAICNREGYAFVDEGDGHYMQLSRAALSAIEASGWALVQVRDGANLITGHAPLDITGIDSVGPGALYIDGLTLDEAWLVLKRSERPKVTT